MPESLFTDRRFASHLTSTRVSSLIHSCQWANPRGEKLQKTTPRAFILPARRLPVLFVHPPRPAHPPTLLAPQRLPPFPSILRTASSSSAKVGSTSSPSPKTPRRRGSSLSILPREFLLRALSPRAARLHVSGAHVSRHPGRTGG